VGSARYSLLRVLALIAGLWAALAVSAHAADLRVLCPTALRVPVLEAARAYARTSGHRIEFVFASVGAIHKRVATGEAVDVAIGTAQGVDALVRLGRGIEGSSRVLTQSRLGFAVPKGSTAPDVSADEGLVRTLRAAVAVVYPDASLGVPGGAQVAALVDRLGLDAELKPKTRVVADAREVVKRVAAGTADVGIASLSDLVGAVEVVVVGPLPGSTAGAVTYAGMIARGAKAAEAGRGFLAHLAGAEAAKIFLSAGYGAPD